MKQMDITTQTANIKRLIKEYFGQLYTIRQLGKKKILIKHNFEICTR